LPEDLIRARLNQFKGNDSVRAASLIKLFRDAGCAESNLTQQPVPKRKQPNVICVLPGAGQDTIVVGAHFDHAEEGSGVVDNWSGASLLPSLLQSLAPLERTHRFVFVGFTGEEDGEIGSTYFAKQMSKDELSHVSLMVNLDSLGLGPTEVWLSRSDRRAVDVLAATAHAMNLPISAVNVDNVGESDEESFIKRNVCTVTLHSVTAETFHILHSEQDALSAIKFVDYYSSYRLIAGYLAVLDQHIGSTPMACPRGRPRSIENEFA